jgi:glycosyltransferase involved in cell wall biosynthesis
LSSLVIVSANSLWNIANFRGGLIEAIRQEGHRVCVAAPGPDDEGPTASTDLHFLPMSRSGLNPFADAILAWRYYRLLRTRRPVALLTFTIKPNIYGAIATRLAGVPLIANVSGLGTAFIRGGRFADFVSVLYRVAFNRAHMVFFQNPDDRQLFLKRRLVRFGRTGLLPGSGIDLAKFRPASPLKDEPPTFLLISRMLADKGVREFVEAAATLKASFPEARFQLLGSLDPENRTAIAKREIDGWVSDGIVESLGPTDDVRPFIAAASAVVLPSYREGLPRTLLEGGAMARPLIATDVPGCREIVTDGETGLLCQVRSASSLAAAMAHFAEMHVDQRQSLGEAARAKVEQEFDQKLVIAAYMEVLRPLLKIADK